MKLCKLFILLICVFIGTSSHAQIITSIAGIDFYSPTPGDGGPATNARIQTPIGIAIDNAGNIFFADNTNWVVRKINTAGIISLVAGNYAQGYSGDGGPATTAQLFAPWGITLDRKGNIYIADAQRVRKVDTSGIITTVAGCGTCGGSTGGGIATAAELQEVSDVKVDNAGNLIIAAGTNIRKVDTSGHISWLAGDLTRSYSGDGGPAISAHFLDLNQMFVDHLGNIYVTDNDHIRKIDTAGIINSIIGGDTSTQGHYGDCGPAAGGELNNPWNVTFDNDGNMFISDFYHYDIRKVDTAGIINTIAGTDTVGFIGDGGSALHTAFEEIRSVATDNAGNMYIADGMHIRKITNYKALQQNCAALSIPEKVTSNNVLSVYPNPNTGSFTVTITSPIDEEINIAITNLLGQQVKTLLASSNKAADFGLHVLPGVYFLTATGSKGIFTKQVIIQ